MAPRDGRIRRKQGRIPSSPSRVRAAQRLAGAYQAASPTHRLRARFSAGELALLLEAPDLAAAANSHLQAEAGGDLDAVYAAQFLMDALLTIYDHQRQEVCTAIKEGGGSPVKEMIQKNPDARRAAMKLVQFGCSESALLGLLSLQLSRDASTSVDPKVVRDVASQWDKLRVRTLNLIDKLRASGYALMPNWASMHNEALLFADQLRTISRLFDSRTRSIRDRLRSQLLRYVEDTTGRPHYVLVAGLLNAIGEWHATPASLAQSNHRNPVPRLTWTSERERQSNPEYPSVQVVFESGD